MIQAIILTFVDEFMCTLAASVADSGPAVAYSPWTSIQMDSCLSFYVYNYGMDAGNSYMFVCVEAY